MRFDTLNVQRGDDGWLPIWTRLAELWRPSFFLSTDAVSAWIDHQQEHAPLKLIVGYQAESPVLACIIGQTPFVRHKFIQGSALHINVSGTPSDDFLYMEYNDVLFDPDADHQLLLAGLLKYLLHQWPTPWDEIVIPGLGVDSPLNRHLRTGLSKSLILRVDKEYKAPYVDLDALRHGSTHYLDTLSSNTRAQIRQTQRAYGDVTLQAASNIAEATAFLHELITFHQLRWSNREQPGAFSQRAQIRFHEDLISRCFPNDGVQLLRVSSEGKTIACLYCLQLAGRVYYYQSGINYSSDNRKRPGLLSHYLAIRHYLDSGYGTYEFLAGHDRYKVSLSNRSKRMRWLRIQRPRVSLQIEHILRRGKTALGI